MNQSEPPSCMNASLYFIGRNSRGNWVVQDKSGQRGGLFTGRAEALRFAMFENGHRPQAVVMVPGTLELELGAKTASVEALAVNEPRFNKQYAA